MESDQIIRDGLACRPFFAFRRAVVAVGLMVGLGFCSLVVRLLCPEHPFRIYMQGATVKHRDAMGVALVPTGKPSPAATFGWSLSGYLVLAETIAYLPGLGLFGGGWQPGLFMALGVSDDHVTAPTLLGHLRGS